MKWISVSERLPSEDGVEVIVYGKEITTWGKDPSKDPSTVHFATYSKPDKLFSSVYYCQYNDIEVTHWMLLESIVVPISDNINSVAYKEDDAG
jgi:hypothetical protein